jgi:hypothetical protein
MKTIKVSEATGATLDWLVAKCEDESIRIAAGKVRFALSQFTNDYDLYSPSTDWAQGGPIIEREEIDLCNYTSRLVSKIAQLWISCKGINDFKQVGNTPLIAAMRCYVASKLGDEVEVPEELL